ncbi:Uncharacterized protein FWK35_00033339, partial [Aphis craccivora]
SFSLHKEQTDCVIVGVFKPCRLTRSANNLDEYSNGYISQLINQDKNLISLAKVALTHSLAIDLGLTAAKKLSNLPPNICNPLYLSLQAEKLSKKYNNIDVTTIDINQMKSLGMHAYLAVSRGSENKPYMSVVQYSGKNVINKKIIILIGKGLTFDSGGISIKPSQNMHEMKYDMCGAAAVYGTLIMAAELNLPLNIIGILAGCENMPGGSAFRPGDILTTMSGKTVEVLNTDAEGRLVLCDVLKYIERFSPDIVIDVATLTGACVVALGNDVTGLFSNNEDLVNDLKKASQQTNDKVWRLPLFKEYEKDINSNVADFSNVGNGKAGAITAACFLSQFTKKYHWAHLDIAGTAWESGVNKGSTGRPVELLSQFLLNMSHYTQYIEEPLYNFWEKNGYFKPNNNLNQPSFCIMMPPPNITGNLHMGHAFQQTIMDILIRYNRMQGKNTLWQVGTDHAGIATQILVERQIYLKEHKTKKDYNRNDFIKKIWLWKKKYNLIVTKQMRRLGNSVDWDREKFTLDPDICHSVKEAFIIFYKNNLIYQKKRLVHWDSKLETVISDLEVEHRLIKSNKWFIRYPIVCNKKKNNNLIKYLIVSTTRPETLLGDTALAVNPEDQNYNQFIGQFVMCPLVNRIIPIIGDQHADITKGTGCVKITPAHDFNDYKIGLRHKLPMINIFTFNGKIKTHFDVYDHKGEISKIYSLSVPAKFQNLDIISARVKIIKEIQKIGLLEKIEECDILTPHSDRSGVIIQPMLTNQWYLKTSKLANLAISAVKDKKVNFIPSQY